MVVDTTALGEDYIRYYGNMNLIHNLGDWNGVQYNQFVYAATTEKYIVDHANGIITLSNGQRVSGTTIRILNGFGSAVRTQLKLFQNPRVSLNYIVPTFPNKDNSNVFMLIPQGKYTIGGAPDYIVTGPRPSAGALTFSAMGATSLPAAFRPVDADVQFAPMPRHCTVPQGATECEAEAR
jgi:hypothetical protein